MWLQRRELQLDTARDAGVGVSECVAKENYRTNRQTKPEIDQIKLWNWPGYVKPSAWRLEMKS